MLKLPLMLIRRIEAVKMSHSKRNRLEGLYYDVVQQLEQLQFQNLRKTAKQYFQTSEVKGWMRFNRKKHEEIPHAKERDRQIPPKQHRKDFVTSECQAFPRVRNRALGSRSKRGVLDREPESEIVVKLFRNMSATSSNGRVERQEYESENTKSALSTSEIGRFRKRIETTETTRTSTTMGCESLPITRRRTKSEVTPIEAECSSTFLHTRNRQHSYQDESPSITRPASMTLRRHFNCNSLMEEVKAQRALDAKLGYRKREFLNAKPPEPIVILRSNVQALTSRRNTNGRTTGASRNEQKYRRRCSEVRLTLSTSSSAVIPSFVPLRAPNLRSISTQAPTSYYLRGKKSELQKNLDCNGATTATDQLRRERPYSSKATLDSHLDQKCRSLEPASRTTVILQDALQALECAHRWNEWGARTLQELARASKAAAERNDLLLSWALKDHDRVTQKKPEIEIPHDNDVSVFKCRGRVLENREEEREFVRDLVVDSGITDGDWVDKDLLKARLHIVSRTPHRLPSEVGRVSFERLSERRNKMKLVQHRILSDFVEEFLKQEIELRRYAQLGMNLTPSMHEHERQGQALVQRLWNHLQICPSPASGSICTTVQNILQRDLQSQSSRWIELAEVMEELDKMVYEDLMQELLEDLSCLNKISRPKQTAELKFRIHNQNLVGRQGIKV